MRSVFNVALEVVPWDGQSFVSAVQSEAVEVHHTSVTGPREAVGTLV